MAKRELPSPQILRQLLDYDSATGFFTWRARSDLTGSGEHLPPRRCASWDGNFAGRRAGTKTKKGYRQIATMGFQIQEHRLAWAFHHGDWPADDIDHINGVKDDNRIENLRDVGASINSRNMLLGRDAKSGHACVKQQPNGKWAVVVARKWIGAYSDLSLAVHCRNAAWRALDFTPRHGRIKEQSETSDMRVER